MKRIWTIIGVSDVRSSFKWYQSRFGHPVDRWRLFYTVTNSASRGVMQGSDFDRGAENSHWMIHATSLARLDTRLRRIS